MMIVFGQGFDSPQLHKKVIQNNYDYFFLFFIQQNISIFLILPIKISKKLLSFYKIILLVFFTNLYNNREYKRYNGKHVQNFDCRR